MTTLLICVASHAQTNHTSPANGSGWDAIKYQNGSSSYITATGPVSGRLFYGEDIEIDVLGSPIFCDIEVVAALDIAGGTPNRANITITDGIIIRVSGSSPQCDDLSFRGFSWEAYENTSPVPTTPGIPDGDSPSDLGEDVEGILQSVVLRYLSVLDLCTVDLDIVFNNGGSVGANSSLSFTSPIAAYSECKIAGTLYAESNYDIDVY